MEDKKLLEILQEIKLGNNLGETITLVGATKTMPINDINRAISLGLKVVAENRVQEFTAKYDFIKGATHHFIGHLQTNKVKYLVGKVDLIHSVDSLKLAQEISRQAIKKGVTQNILVEINIGGELSKSGFNPQNATQAISDIASLPNLKIKGLMAMLPHSNDLKLIENLCKDMRALYNSLKNVYNEFEYLSVGMSGDYKIAIQNGSNMIRLGSLIFGKRNYNEVKNGIV